MTKPILLFILMIASTTALLNKVQDRYNVEQYMQFVSTLDDFLVEELRMKIELRDQVHDFKENFAKHRNFLLTWKIKENLVNKYNHDPIKKNYFYNWKNFEQLQNLYYCPMKRYLLYCEYNLEWFEAFCKEYRRDHIEGIEDACGITHSDYMLIKEGKFKAGTYRKDNVLYDPNHGKGIKKKTQPIKNLLANNTRVKNSPYINNQQKSLAKENSRIKDRLIKMKPTINTNISRTNNTSKNRTKNAVGIEGTYSNIHMRKPDKFLKKPISSNESVSNLSTISKGTRKHPQNNKPQKIKKKTIYEDIEFLDEEFDYIPHNHDDDFGLQDKVDLKKNENFQTDQFLIIKEVKDEQGKIVNNIKKPEGMDLEVTIPLISSNLSDLSSNDLRIKLNDIDNTQDRQIHGVINPGSKYEGIHHNDDSSFYMHTKVNELSPLKIKKQLTSVSETRNSLNDDIEDSISQTSSQLETELNILNIPRKSEIEPRVSLKSNTSIEQSKNTKPKRNRKIILIERVNCKDCWNHLKNHESFLQMVRNYK